MIKLRERIEGVGKKNLLIKNTVRLFKQDYWYILELNVSHLQLTTTLSICNKDIVLSSLGEHKFLIKIEQDQINNFLVVKIPESGSIIIEQLKFFTLGIVDYGFNSTVVKGTLKQDIFSQDYLENEVMNFPTIYNNNKELVSISWDGITLLEEPYNPNISKLLFGEIQDSLSHYILATEGSYYNLYKPGQEFQENLSVLGVQFPRINTSLPMEKTYFRIFAPPLTINERKFLLRWLKQTYKQTQKVY